MSFIIYKFYENWLSENRTFLKGITNFCLYFLPLLSSLGKILCKRCVCNHVKQLWVYDNHSSAFVRGTNCKAVYY